MTDSIDRQDYEAIGKMDKLVSIFTEAVKNKLMDEGRLQELADAAKPEDKSEQAELMKALTLSCFDKDEDEDTTKTDAELGLLSIAIKDVFTRAALRVIPADELAALVPPELADPKYAAILSKYFESSSLAAVIQRPRP